MGKRPSHQEFKEQLNQNFEIQIEGQQPIEIELVQVSELLLSPKQERFSIVFRKPGPDVLPQRIYSIVNGAMGKNDLFLVPMKQDSDAVYYEAVFNRFVD